MALRLQNICGTFLLFFLLTASTAFGQKQSFDCQKLRHEVPYLMRDSAAENISTDSLRRDVGILIRCGGFDSLDRQIMIRYGLFTAIALQQSNHHKPVTYGGLITALRNLKKKKFYKSARQEVFILDTLQDNIITLDNFRKNKSLLLKLHLLDLSDIDDFEHFVVAFQNEHQQSLCLFRRLC